MSTAVTEWEFPGDVVSWINELIAESSGLPFSRAKTEQRTSGSAQRRDVTLLDRHGNPVVTGEIKLPDKADGGTPFNNAVVQDGRVKAQRAKVRYFFTWNVNTCVLWDAERAGESPRGREYRVWQVARVRRSRELAQAEVQRSVRRWLATFLEDVAAELYEEIATRYPRLLRTYDGDLLDPSVACDTYEVPDVGDPAPAGELFAPHSVQFGTGRRATLVTVHNDAQVPLVVRLAADGYRGYLRVPRDPAEAARVLAVYSALADERVRTVQDLVEGRISDEQLQAAVTAALLPALRDGARSPAAA